MIDLSHNFRRSIEEMMEKGRAAMKAGDHSKAATTFDSASHLLLKFADYAPSRVIEHQRKKQALELRDAARRLRSGDEAPNVVTGEDKTESPSKSKKKTDEIKQAVSALIHASPIVWDDIGGLDEVKREIKFTLGITLAKPPENVEISPWRNILFYGPPGTGKTLLAAATSNAFGTEEKHGALFFNVKVSSVMSKYFGESTKIISEIYGTARDASPSVVFLDEFESLAPTRDMESTGAERRILSTILAELDGLAEKGLRDVHVLTIAATNRPWDLDAAVLSRFDKQILIPLPDEDSRHVILDIHLLRRGFKVEANLGELVKATDGFSGREIERFCKEVTTRMIAEMNANLPSALDRGMKVVRDYRVKVRPLTKDDFNVALEKISPQTTSAEIDRYKRWLDK